MDLSRVYSWEMPTRLVVGVGSGRKAGEELKKMGGSRVLVVTDRGVEGAGILGGIFEGLASAGLTYILYTGVEANPSIRCVEESVALYKQEGCDCLLGIGGGSSMDTAKAAGAVMANPEINIRDMEGMGKIKNPIAPMVAVPTTCGTGSEVTTATVITDTERHYKIPILSPYLYPKVALIDGSLLTRLPGPVVAATGMDALCHALESCTNLNTNPISDALDMQAITIIGKWLRPAVANGNLEALSQMVLAATMAGMAFSNTRLTIVHSLSQPVGAFYNVPHGVANAVLLPLVMEFNLLGNAQRFSDVAQALGEETLGLTPMEGARLSVKAVRELSEDIGIPKNFQAYGMREEDIPALIDDAMKSGNIPVNPVKVTREALATILKRSMQ
ncbi:MAG TPA: iron-containing alcohol dehydrogenase [Chloroflexota bacterium]|nr:iron-containing alcohol dehydrogenase [Chloroflexota bacterium]